MKKYLLVLPVLFLVLAGFSCSKSWELDSSLGDYESTPSVELTVPATVNVGNTFQVSAKISHDSSDTQTLHSIDIGESYLNGFVIVSSDPAYSESYLLDDGTYTHTLLTDVPAGEDGKTVTFTLEAVEAGNWRGAFDVCFDDGLNCGFYTVSTYVQ